MGAGELHLADTSGHNAARCRCFCRYVHWMGGIDGCVGCGNCSATLSSTGWRFGCARGVCWHFGDRDSVKVAHECDRHGELPSSPFPQTANRIGKEEWNLSGGEGLQYAWIMHTYFHNRKYERKYEDTNIPS